ncbi:hypothetical protein DD237_003125 [Peronospora effusa]|uniref:Uncharacterized protein n=1 Tax=Peronospora effusa TaxID=542832 RepID=A0A3R7WTL7_9STRA|nr:hypothetical protein DD237_003125 [Peronospora effusa]
MYTMRLLKYALCMCDKESFDETLVLVKTSMLVNKVLQFTQHSILSSKSSAPLCILYSFDACALPGYETMKLASRFAIAEHKNLRQEAKARNTIAFKLIYRFSLNNEQTC